ncbi:TRAP-type C4-dicarboxylate transport system substrate-binding protein [Pacificibacter maritimus]|uniref:TRAP-type C4-dicarboxylate transport system substrate-binding protein n=1 Tax=Pacificibacter maritimus TaxID=762213 RepID=A0A3N4VFA8_9RHOB|nr:TRAP transporter substrate-binding protein [Pacificibacter maritimus]RPE71594.1 TRAP-type C4-dicarboxylate transport system substrate-binding protein [Pacificibacter maritimus]
MRSEMKLTTLAALTALTTTTATAETLIFGTGNPAGGVANEYLLQPWIDKVQAESGDALTLVQRDGPALVNSVNAPERVANNIVQISWTMTVFDPGRFTKSLVATTPFFDVSASAATGVFCQMYEEGLFGDEYDAFQPLYFIPFPQNYIHTKEGPLNSLEDLAGKKIMVESPPAAELIGGFGATPLSINLLDQYQALQRNTADGTVITYTALPAFKLDEVTNYHLEFPLGSAMGMVFMDKARYDALSDEAKAVLDANSGCDVSREAGARVDEWADSVRVSLEDAGHSVVATPAEDVAALREKFLQPSVEMFAQFVEGGAPIIERWVELSMEAEAAEK